MKYNQYEVEANIWLYPGMAGWHFISVPSEVSEEIKDRFGDKAKGWGSLPVTVTVGNTSWQTSIFPDKKTQCYLLPIKAEVRKKECLAANDKITLVIEVC